MSTAQSFPEQVQHEIVDMYEVIRGENLHVTFLGAKNLHVMVYYARQDSLNYSRFIVSEKPHLYRALVESPERSDEILAMFNNAATTGKLLDK